MYILIDETRKIGLQTTDTSVKFQGFELLTIKEIEKIEKQFEELTEVIRQIKLEKSWNERK